ncbi:PAC2 family protein [Gordonia sp. CPCC 205333]|uniref:PAC2 family protein n=1 Tax=Gordonia sp. CPCC 205333 TaxID=3140790 RepID=UPI003AF3CF5F
MSNKDFDVSLRAPILLAAFEGWNDAADAASAAIDHLALSWGATHLTDIESEDYYDFQVNRPTVNLVDGVTRRIDWPVTSFSYCNPPGSDHDIVLLRGIEPNMRWRTFCDEIVAIASALDVVTTVVVGALLADTPHTRPVPVTGAAYSSATATKFGLTESRYEGPTGIAGVLQDAFVRAGIPAISLWAAVPHYMSAPPNPKATAALLTRIEEVIDIEVPLGSLPAEAEEWEETVNEMTEDDDEVRDYVRGLEERGDAQTNVDEALSEIDGESLAADFERYLKRRRPNPPNFGL